MSRSTRACSRSLCKHIRDRDAKGHEQATDSLNTMLNTSLSTVCDRGLIMQCYRASAETVGSGKRKRLCGVYSGRNHKKVQVVCVLWLSLLVRFHTGHRAAREFVSS